MTLKQKNVVTEDVTQQLSQEIEEKTNFKRQNYSEDWLDQDVVTV